MCQATLGGRQNVISELETRNVSTKQLSFYPKLAANRAHIRVSFNTKDRAMYRAHFRLNLAGFFTHLPNCRVACGIAIRHRVRDSDRDIRAQRGRVTADTPE